MLKVELQSMLHYQDVVNCLSHYLQITNLPELIIMYICDGNVIIDWFSIPKEIQYQIETQCCVTTINNDRKETKLGNYLHSCGDLPALDYIDQYSTKIKEWYKSGQLHRDNDLPAVSYHDGQGYKEWRKNGQLYRDNDLPAIERGFGTKEWYKNGQLHRDNDLPAIERPEGTKAWYKNGQLHRDNDLPAYDQFDGFKAWYKNGQLHRDNDLPAQIMADGIRKEWWINGQKINYTMIVTYIKQ